MSEHAAGWIARLWSYLRGRKTSHDVQSARSAVAAVPVPLVVHPLTPHVSIAPLADTVSVLPAAVDADRRDDAPKPVEAALPTADIVILRPERSGPSLLALRLASASSLNAPSSRAKRKPSCKSAVKALPKRGAQQAALKRRPDTRSPQVLQKQRAVAEIVPFVPAAARAKGSARPNQVYAAL